MPQRSLIFGRKNSRSIQASVLQFGLSYVGTGSLLAALILDSRPAVSTEQKRAETKPCVDIVAARTVVRRCFVGRRSQSQVREQLNI